jgi:hypothetical protein
MRKLTIPLLTLAALSVGLVACYGGGVSTGVYVGVGVPGPYVGRPGYGGYMGPPPVIYYDEDSALLPAETDERYALSIDEVNEEARCEEGPKGTVECASESESRARAADQESDDSDGGS